MYPVRTYVHIRLGPTPWDLYLCIGYTTCAGGLVALLGVGTALSIPLVFLAPGYPFVAALFPERDHFGWGTRLALSVGISLAIVPVLALFLDIVGIGIHVSNVALVLVGVSDALCLVGMWRRLRLPPTARLSGSIELVLSRLGNPGSDVSAVAVLLAVALVVGMVVTATLFTVPAPQEQFTEFYLLGPNGIASGYPTALNVSQTGTVIVGIANHETTKATYIIHVDLVGVRIVYNASSRVNETVEVNRTTWSAINVTLADGGNWTQPYTFSIPYVGLWKVQFVLFKEGDFPSAYRELHLFIRVT